ncbi:RNA-binding domain-containing protein [Thermincola potens]|uniref:Putative transcriptional regulator n=1 Tax=Thermincola potens (strain JR) TaxID=635013 RepID=D5XE74_THEPJ|nr:RNA-binding domain-containing protein [Thermincola potens]ADG81945.1 putative transcriptional regulator [Thermincola potens JR]
MTKLELLEIITNGENSAVEFKRDTVKNTDLAEEIVAFSNTEGGMILLGVEDDGQIIGTTRADIEEWLMNICSQSVIPAVIPHFERIRVDEGKCVVVLRVPKGVNKPYQTSSGRFYIRVGTTKRLVSKEELARLFQMSGLVHFDTSPVYNTSKKDLNMNKIRKYYLDFNQFDLDEMLPDDAERILLNSDIMTEVEGVKYCTVGGLLIFGKNPEKHLPQSGVSFAVYDGNEISSKLLDKKNVEGTIDEVVDTTSRLIKTSLRVPSDIKGLKREDKPVIPDVVIREVLVNAVVHRNYSISGSKIRVFVFVDRLEIISPGRLPNTVTVEKMKTGVSFSRNPFLMKYMENFRYVDRLGRGVPMVISEMKKSVGIEPVFEERGEEFYVSLQFERIN